MIAKILTTRCDLIIAGLILLFALILGSLSAAAADASDENRSYCVKMGYLYRSSPTVNNGQGYCVFPSGGWCDANAFRSGTCGPRPFPSLISVDYYGPYGDRSASAYGVCQGRGGQIRNVHTPYGDTTFCVLPNGSTIDLRSLYGGLGGYRWGYNSDYAWYYYAQSWLNAP
jgi:putative hemolysin